MSKPTYIHYRVHIYLRSIYYGVFTGFDAYCRTSITGQRTRRSGVETCIDDPSPVCFSQNQKQLKIIKNLLRTSSLSDRKLVKIMICKARVSPIPFVDKARSSVTLPRRMPPPVLMPSPFYHSSNHMWINAERRKASLSPLSRSSALDALAREHAHEMAESGETFRFSHQSSAIKENTRKGPSVQIIHRLIMCMDGEAKANILNPDFQEFGMGSIKGKDKNMYVCQLFV